LRRVPDLPDSASVLGGRIARWLVLLIALAWALSLLRVTVGWFVIVVGFVVIVGFVKDKKLHFTYNYLTRTFFRIVGEDELPEGDLTILYESEVTSKGDKSQGNGPPGTGTLYVNDKKVGSVDMDVTVPYIFCIEGLSVSHDYGDSVDHANYKPTFPFTGTVKKVTYDLSGDAISNAEAETRRGMAHQ
jgi:arylsulfatase